MTAATGLTSLKISLNIKRGLFFLTLEEKFAKIDTVTADGLQRVARNIFTNNKLNLAVIGPFKNTKSLKKILRF